MPTTAEHIKGSDLPESIRERLQALPNRWYTITLKEEDLSSPFGDDAHQTFFKAVEDLAAEDDLPEDYSSQIKHYLYDTPKK